MGLFRSLTAVFQREEPAHPSLPRFHNLVDIEERLQCRPWKVSQRSLPQDRQDLDLIRNDLEGFLHHLKAEIWPRLQTAQLQDAFRKLEAAILRMVKETKQQKTGLLELKERLRIVKKTLNELAQAAARESVSLA